MRPLAFTLLTGLLLGMAPAALAQPSLTTDPNLRQVDPGLVLQHQQQYWNLQRTSPGMFEPMNPDGSVHKPTPPDDGEPLIDMTQVQGQIKLPPQIRIKSK